MTRPTIDATVVIAAWNAEPFVGRAIRSALDQQNVEIEVVVADDASTDRTLAVARDFGDPRIRCLTTDRNGGPGAARNRAIAAARGRWLAILDADDAMLPGRLERLVALGDAKGADVVVDNIALVGAGAGETMFEPRDLGRDGELRLDEFVLSNRPFKGRYNLGYLKPIFRSDFVVAQDIRYDESLRIGEDYVFLAEALAADARCLVEPAPGYLYTVREGSASHRLTPAHLATIRAADAALLRRRPFTGAALTAQRRRDRSLRKAEAFVTAVDAIKARAWPAALAALARHPEAALLFRLPFAVRARRVFALLGS